MTAEAAWLDGNALGGLLAELFGTEMTSVDHGCGSCGAHNAVGAHRLYLGAGAVLRCPVCGDVAIQVATLTDRHVVHLRGSWRLEMPG
jgi:hypothetical protein